MMYIIPHRVIFDLLRWTLNAVGHHVSCTILKKKQYCHLMPGPESIDRASKIECQNDRFHPNVSY